MGFRKVKPLWGLFLSAPIFAAGAGSVAFQAGPRVGGPLPGLTQEQLAAFNAGQQEFLHNEGPPDGLGPVFNGTSCVNCHQAGAVGGASANLGVSVVTRIGAMVNGIYSDLPDVGGPVLQARSLRQFLPNYPVPGEVVPRSAQFVSRRITTPVFGAGLVEAVPDSVILDFESTPQPDGIHGVANRVIDPETGETRIGRFGWKAQHATLLGFAADAYLNEMGITNPLFPQENRPQGHPIPPGADPVADPEDEGGDVESIATFMRLLDAPRQIPSRDRTGVSLFNTAKCNACHVPYVPTGSSPIAALNKKVLALYSDLLLHRMGPGLADGIHQGAALGDQWRTAPLWGLSSRPFLLHDGRATSVDQAIRLHGGEATASRDRYVAMSATDRQRLLTFLAGL